MQVPETSPQGRSKGDFNLYKTVDKQALIPNGAGNNERKWIDGRP